MYAQHRSVFSIANQGISDSMVVFRVGDFAGRVDIDRGLLYFGAVPTYPSFDDGGEVDKLFHGADVDILHVGMDARQLVVVPVSDGCAVMDIDGDGVTFGDSVCSSDDKRAFPR